MTGSINSTPDARARWHGIISISGNIALFALLGWWAGTVYSALSPAWGALLGGAIGLAMGTSCRPWHEKRA